MGKKTHMGNSRKAVHKLNSSSVKYNKSTCSHKCGPSDHGRNVAPEMSAHNTGPRYIPKSNKISSQRIQIGCILPDFDSSRSSIKSLKAKRRRIAKKRRKQLLALSPISLDGSKPMDRDDTMDKKFTYFSQLSSESLIKIAIIMHDLYNSYDLSLLALKELDQKEDLDFCEVYLECLSQKE
jgi:hypothetical protein